MTVLSSEQYNYTLGRSRGKLRIGLSVAKRAVRTSNPPATTPCLPFHHHHHNTYAAPIDSSSHAAILIRQLITHIHRIIIVSRHNQRRASLVAEQHHILALAVLWPSMSKTVHWLVGRLCGQRVPEAFDLWSVQVQVEN